MQIFQGVLLASSFASVHVSEQFDSDRIALISRRDAARRVSRRCRVAGNSQLLDPLSHHLHVAQLTQRLEEFLPRLLHLLPRRIGIDRHQSIGQRTAAPQRNPKIVHRIDVETGGRPIALHQHATIQARSPSLGLEFAGFGPGFGVGLVPNVAPYC